MDRTSNAPAIGRELAHARLAAAGPARVPAARRLVELARQAVAAPAGHYDYKRVRPLPYNLFAGGIFQGDCSWLVINIYRAAGLPDPSGNGYDGQGFTGDLEGRGRLVSGPDPGRLAFWAAPDHVAICLDGAGTIAEFGGPPVPIYATVAIENAYHGSFLGFRDYITAGEHAGAGAGTGRPAVPNPTDYDSSDLIRTGWDWWGYHGRRAQANTAKVKALLDSTRYVTPAGPQ